MFNQQVKKTSILLVMPFSLLLAAGCGGSDPSSQFAGNKPPSLSIKSISCPSTGSNEICRDIGRLIVEYTADDGQSVSVSGRLLSNSLNMSIPLEAVAENLEQDLFSFSGVQDVTIELTATDPNGAFTTVSAVIGEIDVNNSPTCSGVELLQDFIVDPTGNNVALIDISQCSDAEQDLISLSNEILDLSTVRNYSQRVSITDNYGSLTNYGIQGEISLANLTREEFFEQIINNPIIIGADSCFPPINLVFDEAVVCDFQDEWIALQYDSSQDTSGFANIALPNSAQGFVSLAAGVALDNIIANFIKPAVADNQAVASPGNTDIVVTATIDRDSSGAYSKLLLSGSGYNLQGVLTENSTISCENNSFILPPAVASISRSSSHSIDQTFVVAIAQTRRITNCVSVNSAGEQTFLEGDIDIVINDLINQNPVVNSVVGLDSGMEGIRTIVANVMDPDANLNSVVLRYRASGSNAAWTEVTLSPEINTDNFNATVELSYNLNINELGNIEYQIIVLDTFGGQGVSTLATAIFDTNEATAQATIEDELTTDSTKIIGCFDCTFLDQSGADVGPFDAVFSDATGNQYIYEYNGEGRTAADLQALEDSLIGTSVIYYNVPIGTINSIRTNIQNN